VDEAIEFLTKSGDYEAVPEPDLILLDLNLSLVLLTGREHLYGTTTNHQRSATGCPRRTPRRTDCSKHRAADGEAAIRHVPRAALGSIGISPFFQFTGDEKKANFVGHWAPTFLLLGLYNKLVKLHGSEGV
jgi:hypothetical protein